MSWLWFALPATFIWMALFYEPHICSVVGVEACHESTGRKHG